MSRWGVTAIGMFAASAMLAVMACGDDYDESSATGPREGTFDGACYRNSTCDDGLVCAVIDGQARCRPAPAAVEADAGLDGEAAADASSDAGMDASAPPGGEVACAFEATPFPCADPSLTACHGASIQPSCESSCSGVRTPWRCHSPEQCGGNYVCCLAPGDLRAEPRECQLGKLEVEDAVPKTVCDVACTTIGRTLCRTNGDCPGRATCRPYRVEGSAESLRGYIVGICD